jgi:hypothetical protein
MPILLWYNTCIFINKKEKIIDLNDEGLYEKWIFFKQLSCLPHLKENKSKIINKKYLKT